MGFLLGAYGKLAAGSRKRAIQARMMRIQSRARRVTREVKNAEDMINRLEKTNSQSLTLQSTVGKNLLQQQMYTGLNSNQEYTDAMKKVKTYNSQDQNNKTVTEEQYQAATSTISRVSAQFQQINTSASAMLDTYTQMQKMDLDNRIQTLKDTLLEPLKDEEDSLEEEKESLESELQIATADYDACKKMEQQDAKDLAPNYTAGQQ